uniref:Uncharacterized protein n=1 Tax=Solanum tuberosum TaxID=4113 RepID=M1DZ32_SOLTU
MLKNDMNIDCLVIHAQLFEREKLEERFRGTKRYRFGDDNFSQERFYGPRSSKVAPKLSQKRVSTPKSQGVSGSGYYVIRPTCARCGKRHDAREREKKKSRFNDLQARGEQEYPPNVAISEGRESRLVLPCYSLVPVTNHDYPTQLVDPPTDMTSSRAHVQRNEEDNVEQAVPLQAPPKATIVPIVEYVSKENIGEREKKKSRFAALQARSEQEYPPNVASGFGDIGFYRRG